MILPENWLLSFGLELNTVNFVKGSIHTVEICVRLQQGEAHTGVNIWMQPSLN